MAGCSYLRSSNSFLQRLMRLHWFHIDGVGGRAAGQDMIFQSSPLTHAGYLNRPNWLLAGYCVYHRVASQPGSQPTMCMSGPRSRHQRRCVRDATDLIMNVWWYTAEKRVRPYQYQRTLNQRSIAKPLSPSHRVCIRKFLVRYIVTWCIFCAPSGLRQGQVFTPQRHVPVPVLWRCPPRVELGVIREF